MPKETIEEFLKRGGKIEHYAGKGQHARTGRAPGSIRRIFPGETVEQRKQRLHEESVGLGDRPRSRQVNPVGRAHKKYATRKQNILSQIISKKAKKTGLLGLGLTVASLGSSIKEARKK